MNFNWYSHYPADWKRDTLHLSLAEEGAYRRLNDEYMVNGGPIPDNDAALARLIGIPLEQWMAVAAVVRQFYQASNGKLVHKRCEKELYARVLHAQCTSIKNKKAAMIRWENERKPKLLENNNNDALALRTQYARNADAMQKHATLQSKYLNSSSSFVAARAREEVFHSPPARALATALPAGALASEPKSGIAAKRPSEVTRQELEERYAQKRNEASPDISHETPPGRS